MVKVFLIITVLITTLLVFSLLIPRSWKYFNQKQASPPPDLREGIFILGTIYLLSKAGFKKSRR